jgi:Arylsulfotransferase (ASST)
MIRLTKKFGALLVSLLGTGVFYSASAFSDGYILSGAWSGKTTMLYDNKLKIVNTWDHSKLSDSLNGYSSYIMPNGHLLRSAQAPTIKKGSTQISPPLNAAPQQGIIDEIDAQGKVVWTYQLSDSIYMLHHDFKLLPNGNILAVAFVRYSRSQFLAAGVDSTLLGDGQPAKVMLGEKIVEIKPDYTKGGGSIVWEWTMFDHVAPKSQALNNPRLISGSIVKALWSGQWVHLNGIEFDSTRNLIVFTSRIFSELYVIDHSTTTEEAKGHSGGKHGMGGDILYRWGHTSNYLENGTQRILVLHCPTVIPNGYPGEGNIMFFHNNLNGTSGASEVVEITPPFDNNGKFLQPTATGFGPESPTWIYAPTSNFRSDYMSSTFRLPNGNTLIHEAYPSSGSANPMSAGGRIREVTNEQAIIDTASLSNGTTPNPGTFGTAFNPAKIMYYPSSYIGIKNLLAALNVSCKSPQYSSKHTIQILPNASKILFENANGYTVGIFALNGKAVISLHATSDRVTLNTSNIPAGTYLVKIINGKTTLQNRIFTHLL